jgi:hypothetical protein
LACSQTPCPPRGWTLPLPALAAPHDCQHARVWGGGSVVVTTRHGIQHGTCWMPVPRRRHMQHDPHAATPRRGPAACPALLPGWPAAGATCGRFRGLMAQRAHGRHPLLPLDTEFTNTGSHVPHPCISQCSAQRCPVSPHPRPLPKKPTVFSPSQALAWATALVEFLGSWSIPSTAHQAMTLAPSHRSGLPAQQTAMDCAAGEGPARVGPATM